MLRAGKLPEAQQKLLEKHQMELLEWVSGGAPAFDNTSFLESDEYGEFLPNDIDRAGQI